jgi:hypothetical protein
MEWQKLFAIPILFFITVLLTACGGDQATQTPSIPLETAAPTRRPLIVPTTPAGWKAYSRSSFQIALPNSWQEIKLGESELRGSITAAQESNPPLAEQLRGLLESGQYQELLFYATETAGAPLPPNVSVAHIALDADDSLESIARSYASALPNIVRGSKIVEVQSSLQINGIRAASFVYDVSLVDSPGALQTLRGVQFLFLLDTGDAYLVTITASGSDADTFMPLAREIATSFVAVTP